MNFAHLPAAGILGLLLLGLAFLGLVTSFIYLCLVLLATRRYKRNALLSVASVRQIENADWPPVTVLKPLHGMEPGLEKNLESFFQQDYPNFEIIFGVREASDPALAVVERLHQNYPQVKSRVVLSGPPTWANAKVFSQQKMLAFTSARYIIMSDSDVCVGPDLLQNVVAPLLDEKIGLVTCPYRGVPAPGLGSSLEALGMSVEMTSGVIVADMLEGMRFALGPVTAARREVLEQIGGFPAVADYYSDDFELGQKIWAAGYKVIFSHYVIEHVLTPRRFWRTLADQLRWMKSTRYSRPAGHVGTGLTYAVPFGLLGLIASAVSGRLWLGVACLSIAWLNRMVQSLIVGWGIVRDRRALRLCWLYPLRDLLGFCLWLASFTGRGFVWRGEKYSFRKGGKIIAADRAQ
ncbi:MAG TPA: glycosyltransferase [Terriglobales bacterium]|jgi:ceramide glucosyltransferase